MVNQSRRPSFYEVARQQSIAPRPLFDPSRRPPGRSTIGRVRDRISTLASDVGVAYRRLSKVPPGGRLIPLVMPGIGGGLAKAGSSILSYFRGPSGNILNYLGKIGTRAGVFGALAGVTYGVSRAVQKSNLPSEVKVGVSAGAAAASPFGLLGSVVGGAEYAGNTLADIYRKAREGVAGVNMSVDIPTFTMPEIEIPEINYPDIATSFVQGDTNISMPSSSTTISTGGGGLDPAILAILLGVSGGVGYAVGRRKRKYKKKRKSKRR